MRDIIVYLRFLSKHKMLAAINVFGLSIGIASCIFIGLFINHELSYDAYHTNADRIFALTSKFGTPEAMEEISTTSSPIAPELKQNYPEVEDVVRLDGLAFPTVEYDNKVFREHDIYEADPQIFDVFSYRILKGDPATALTGGDKIVVTETFAAKYFGSEDPIGKAITVNRKLYQVSALMEDVPSNSDLRFAALVPTAERPDDWWGFGTYVYVLLKESYLKDDPGARSFADKLGAFADRQFNDELKKQNESVRIQFAIQSLPEVHFREGLLDDTPKGNIRYVYILGCVAILLLLIACLNFINFALLQSTTRGREVGIRKVVGARFGNLVVRYLSESILVTALGFVGALVIVALLMPLFNDITGKDFQFADLMTLQFFAVAMISIVVVGALAGSYPAFYTSSIRPLISLKGKIVNVRGMGFRKVAIVAQFAIAIGLISATFLISNQMEFVSGYDLGFRKDNIVVIEGRDDSLSVDRMKALKDALSSNSNIKSVAHVGYSGLPGNAPAKASVTTKVGEETRVVDYVQVDEHYFPTLEIRITGRNFDASSATNPDGAVIINKQFAEAWGWDNPLEETIVWKGKDIPVIGVVDDFHFLSLHNQIAPAMFFYDHSVILHVLVRFNNSFPVSEQVPLLSNAWSKLFPDQPFVYNYLDQSIAKQYLAEEKAVRLFTIFSILTIAVSCLGLFGLCSLTIAQRKKEVGIRRIVGATFGSIVVLFSKEYLMLIGLAFIMITPVIVAGIKRWLETFPVRGDISIGVFVTTAIAVILLGIFTVTFSIARTSRTSPSELIRE